MSSRRDAYVAIADPTRRAILDLLRVCHALPAGEIARHFDSTSRPGISRHLRVLRECGVVRRTRHGKEQLYAIEPTPLRDIRDGFLAGFSEMHTTSLQRLRDTVERSRGPCA